MPKKILGKKAAAKKHTKKSGRKRTPTATEIILSSVTSRKIPKRLNPYAQLRLKNLERDINKRKFAKGKGLTKSQKKLYTYVKKYKSGLAKQYKKELVIAMKEKGYFKAQIERAKEYSLVGQNVKRELAKYAIYNRGMEKVWVNGKYITKKSAAALLRRTVKKARLKSYQDILGITKKKAEQILKLIDNKSPAANKFLALIY